MDIIEKTLNQAKSMRIAIGKIEGRVITLTVAVNDEGKWFLETYTSRCLEKKDIPVNNPHRSPKRTKSLRYGNYEGKEAAMAYFEKLVEKYDLEEVNTIDSFLM